MFKPNYKGSRESMRYRTFRWRFNINLTKILLKAMAWVRGRESWILETLGEWWRLKAELFEKEQWKFVRILGCELFFIWHPMRGLEKKIPSPCHYNTNVKLSCERNFLAKNNQLFNPVSFLLKMSLILHQEPQKNVLNYYLHEQT
jgi:hypothetical protein